MNQVPSVEREPAAVELRRVKIAFAALYFFFANCNNKLDTPW